MINSEREVREANRMLKREVLGLSSENERLNKMNDLYKTGVVVTNEERPVRTMILMFINQAVLLALFYWYLVS